MKPEIRGREAPLAARQRLGRARISRSADAVQHLACARRQRLTNERSGLRVQPVAGIVQALDPVLDALDVLELLGDLFMGLLSLIGAILKGIWDTILGIFGWD